MYKVSAVYKTGPDTYFDKDYYLKYHVDLAVKQSQGKLNIHKIEVEWDEEEIDWANTGKPNPENIVASCRFSIFFETVEDLGDFYAFFKSPDVEPLREDAKKYTNCDIVWYVSNIADLHKR
jgi:hypothetical protein